MNSTRVFYSNLDNKHQIDGLRFSRPLPHAVYLQKIRRPYELLILYFIK